MCSTSAAVENRLDEQLCAHKNNNCNNCNNCNNNNNNCCQDQIGYRLLAMKNSAHWVCYHAT